MIYIDVTGAVTIYETKKYIIYLYVYLIFEKMLNLIGVTPVVAHFFHCCSIIIKKIQKQLHEYS